MIAQEFKITVECVYKVLHRYKTVEITVYLM